MDTILAPYNRLADRLNAEYWRVGDPAKVVNYGHGNVVVEIPHFPVTISVFIEDDLYDVGTYGEDGDALEDWAINLTYEALNVAIVDRIDTHNYTG